jgi:hypothetical protein
MSPDKHLAYRVVRAAYTAAQDRETETGTFDITPHDIEFELVKLSDQIDNEARLKRIVDLLPWAQERLRAKLISAVAS